MIRLLLGLTFVVFSLHGPAQANETCQVQNSEDGYQSLRFVVREITLNKRNNNCYGGPADQTPWVVEINGRLDQIPEADAVTIRPQLTAVFRNIRTRLDNEMVSVASGDRLAQSLAQLSDLPVLNDEDLLPAGSRADDWRSAGGFTSIAIGDKDDPVNLNAVLESGCSDSPVDWSSCEPQVRKAEMLLTYWTLTSKTLGKYIRSFGREVLVDLELLNDRWEAYFYEARPQNFLEVGFNSWRFNKNNEGEDRFLSPPDYQWIWLHPNIALEYIDDVPSGSRFQESLVLEIFGRNDWTWKDNSAEMIRPIGWSIIASFTDREAVDGVGWGLMFHIDHKYSFAFTDREGDKGFLISIDLVEFFGDLDQASREKFAGYGELLKELADN